jgi:hypothetical protein
MMHGLTEFGIREARVEKITTPRESFCMQRMRRGAR